MDYRKWIWIPIVFVGISTVGIGLYRFNNRFSELGEFQEVEKETILNSKFTVLDAYKGVSYLRFKNGEQFAIGQLSNKTYEPSAIWKHLATGDSLAKRKDSDTLYVYNMYGNDILGVKYFLLRKKNN
jgi:hypothetical protein